MTLSVLGLLEFFSEREFYAWRKYEGNQVERRIQFMKYRREHLELFLEWDQRCFLIISIFNNKRSVVELGNNRKDQSIYFFPFGSLIVEIATAFETFIAARRFDLFVKLIDQKFPFFFFFCTFCRI